MVNYQFVDDQVVDAKVEVEEEVVGAAEQDCRKPD